MTKRWIAGLALLATGFLSGQVSLSQSLTACYALNGNGTEPISSLTATLNAVTPTVDRFNSPSSALAFGGTTLSYLELPGDPLLKPTNAFSFSGWVKTSLMTDQYILMTKNPVSFNFESYCLHLGNFNGQLRIRAKKGDGTGNSTIITGTNSLSTDTWYHFVLTVDNSNLKVYTNGMLDASAPTTFPFIYQAGKNVILGGSNEPNFDLPFTGSMDNLRFYNRVLNAGEISALYSQDPSCIALQAPVASFSVSSISVCAGGTLTLTDLSSNSPTSWNWQVPGGSTGNAFISNPTYTFMSPGIFTASLVASNAAGPSVNTATQTIVVFANPVISTSSSATLVCKSDWVTLYAYGAVSYSWSVGQTGAVISDRPLFQTNYTVYGTDSNGCVGSNTILIRVSTCAVSPLGVSSAGGMSALAIYPNPAPNVVTLSGQKDMEITLQLLNMNGEIIYTQRVTGAIHTIDLATYPRGIYFLKCSSGHENRVFKVIRE